MNRGPKSKVQGPKFMDLRILSTILKWCSDTMDRVGLPGAPASCRRVLQTNVVRRAGKMPALPVTTRWRRVPPIAFWNFDPV